MQRSQGPNIRYFSMWFDCCLSWFFSPAILQLLSIHVTVLPYKSIWINFASKMLYGSEYIISLSHREKIYCNHPAFLLIISIKGSRGRENAQDSSRVWSFFEVFAIHCLILSPFLLSFMLFSACTNAENDVLNCLAWNFCPLEPSLCCLCDLIFHHTFP